MFKRLWGEVHAAGSMLPLRIFFLPVVVMLLLAVGIFGSHYALVIAVSIGIAKIIVDSYENISEGHYSLDYIAFTAMLVSLLTGEFLPGAVIAFMFVGGEALEAFASDRAERTLRALADRIPKTCLVRAGDSFSEVPIQQVVNGSVILLKSGELVPLDGTLMSDTASFDVSSLTGEAEPVDLSRGAFVKSGSINVGETIELRVAGDFTTSTYHRIVGLVEEARRKPTRFVRFSERVNLPFTLAAFALSAGAYAMTGEAARALAVLVIATPCPLIIAAPVAFIGGLSRAARQRIIVRTPSSLETLSHIDAVFFDKTGTLTLGTPALSKIEFTTGVMTSEIDVLAIAAAIEVHSLHPLARAIVAEARRRAVVFSPAQDVEEKIGTGISGTVDGVRYTIGRCACDERHIGIILTLSRGDLTLALLSFSDVMKENTGPLFDAMRSRGIEVGIITGDRSANAQTLFGSYHVVIHADASPEDKFRIVREAKDAGKTVMMVGDGLNDAPALASADVGVVFSGAENTASVEAANIAILDHGLDHVSDLIAIAERSVRIAKQSVYGGIALSLIGMVGAAAGLIAPLPGALLQEGIDVLVILNALRTLR